LKYYKVIKLILNTQHGANYYNNNYTVAVIDIEVHTNSQSLHSSLEDYICVLKERLLDTNTKHTVPGQDSGNFHSHKHAIW